MVQHSHVRKSGSRKKVAARKRASARRSSSHRRGARGGGGGRRWSHKVTESSNALDLKQGVFKQKNPRKIAASLKRSAEHSRRRKADPFRSALSMLTFYINRAGKNLSAARKNTLKRAKNELRKQFGRE